MRSPLTLLLVAALVVPLGIFADMSPIQPIYGFSWPTHSIPVLIEPSSPNATHAVERAMSTWNLAQQWFITTYRAGAGTPFSFYETNSTSDSMVTVAFNQTQTMDDLGVTHWNELHDQQGVIKVVTVSMSLDLTSQTGQVLSDSELQTLATHELGHALGLDHTTFSASDLMNHEPKVMFPSTLNLYAVYLLSQSSNKNNLPQQPVTLPDNIPYVMVSQAQLDTATPPAVQSATTSSQQLTQLLSTMAYGPWPYVGILVVLAVAVIAVAFRGRRRTPTADLEGVEVIFHENPINDNQPTHPEQAKKKCQYCGAEVPPHDSICRKCGMPAMYRK
jgi:hypothetical protein